MSIQSSELFNQKSLEEQHDQLNQKLPGFIVSNMIAEITNDPEFRIERMGRKTWKLPEKYTGKEDCKIPPKRPERSEQTEGGEPRMDEQLTEQPQVSEPAQVTATQN